MIASNGITSGVRPKFPPIIFGETAEGHFGRFFVVSRAAFGSLPEIRTTRQKRMAGSSGEMRS
jgi:hypothetical protein